MNKMKKIISFFSVFAMVVSLMGTVAVNAAIVGTPNIAFTISQDGKNVGDEVVVDVTYSGNNGRIYALQYEMPIDSEYFSVKSATDPSGEGDYDDPVAQTGVLKYGQTWANFAKMPKTESVTITQVKLSVLKDLPETGITLTPSNCQMKIEYRAASADAEDQLLYLSPGSAGYDDNEHMTVTSATVNAPAPSITVTAENDTVVKGESTKVTATPANFAEAPTEYVWTVEGATSKDTKVVGTDAEATLIIGADETAATVTVKATVGEVSGTTTVNVADKIYPLTITPASDFDSDNRITLNIAPTPGEGYVAGTPYDVVAQFYTADGTASGYVEIKNLTDNQTLIVGSQNAGKVNVTLSNENGIIGRLEK